MIWDFGSTVSFYHWWTDKKTWTWKWLHKCVSWWYFTDSGDPWSNVIELSERALPLEKHDMQRGNTFLGGMILELTAFVHNGGIE